MRAYSAWRTSTLANLPRGYEPPVLLVQLSHGGLQSSGTVNASRWPWQPAVAPTSARPDTASNVGGIIGFLGWLWARIMWPVPSRQIVDFDEWEDIVQMFVQAAITVEKAGYDGVQVHSAHGYLLAEYLSPLVRAQLNVPVQVGADIVTSWDQLNNRLIQMSVRYQMSQRRYRFGFTFSGRFCRGSGRTSRTILLWRSRSTARTLCRVVCT